MIHRLSYFSDPIAILSVLFLIVAVTEWLVSRTVLRHIGTALAVIAITAAVANLRIIPANPAETPLYAGIFRYVAPFAIFLPLLQVNLRDVLKAGLPMIGAFGLGAAGTVLGVVTGMWVVDGADSIGEHYRSLGGMFTGTYIGGGVNFNALALHYGITKEGVLFAGSTAVDNIMTALWMAVTLALPRALSRGVARIRTDSSAEHFQARGQEDEESVKPLHLGLLLGLGGAAMWLSDSLAAWMASLGVTVPSVLLLTTLSLLLAQLPAVKELRGKRVLGMFAVYLFLAVIGAHCDLRALGQIGPLGVTLLGFVLTAVLIHGLILFGLGRLLGMDWRLLAIASQANVGGATSALALARSLDERSLVLPAVLVGSLGYGLGTYLGFLTAEYLL